MKLLVALILFAQSAFALNFNGVQTLHGLATTPIFTAPASGIYFITGYLTLPQYSGLGVGGQSKVVATVSKNSVTSLYVGLAGASGFSLPQITLVSNDLITVGLSSAALIDAVTQDAITGGVRGDVYFGNAF